MKFAIGLYPITLLSTLAFASSVGAKPEQKAKGPIDGHHIQVRDYLGDLRSITDTDGDGWSDLWAVIYPNIEHRDRSRDTDGDGLTDYEEMVMWRDPFVKGPIPRKPTPEEIAQSKRNAKEAEKLRIARMAERRQQLSKFVIAPLSKMDGSPASKREVKEERKLAAAKSSSKLRTKSQLEFQRAKKLAGEQGMPTKFILPDGRTAAISGASFGYPEYNVTLNAIAADTISTDEVLAGGTSGLSLSGDGQVIGIWDGGDVLTTHTEFTAGGSARVVDRDGTSGLGVQHHPTHVAGTMVASGVDVDARGMSPAANLDAYDFSDHFTEISNAVANTTMRISNHSYGLQRGWGFRPVGGQNFLAWWGDISISSTEDFRYGFYDSDAVTLDTIAYQELDYLGVWAAGNERGSSGVPGIHPSNGYYVINGGSWNVSTEVRPDDFANSAGYDLLGARAVAKNVLTVGAVEDIIGGYSQASDVVISSFSSFGPPDDGRVKPDIVANGVNVYSTTSDEGYANDSGTSMAAPSVTGSLALIREHWMDLFDTVPLRAASLKGLVIHTADEAGDHDGPDYRFGWGLMNTRSAVELLTDQEQSIESLPHIKQALLSNGDYVEFTVRALGNEPLRITASWTDPPGTVPPNALDVNTDATRALVNDLDLRVISSMTTYYPWKLDPANPTAAATRLADNNRDNVEQVLIDAPVAGQEFTVRVTHKDTLMNDAGAVAPQELSLILSGMETDSAPDFRVLDISATGVDQHTITWASVVGATYRIETLHDLVTDSWVTIPGDYVATKEITAAEVLHDTSENLQFWRVRRLP